MSSLSDLIARLRASLALPRRQAPARPPRRRPLAHRPVFEQLEARDVPTLVGNQLFPSDNPWNQKITNAPVAANSAAIISSIGASTPLHPDFGTTLSDGTLNGIPYNVVHGNTAPKVSFVLGSYASESDNVPVPMPANPVIEGDGGTGGTDHHMIVYDQDNNIAYELGNVTRPDRKSTRLNSSH